MSIDDDEKQQKLKEVARQVCETIRSRPKWEKTILSEFERSMLFDKNLVYEVIKNQKNGLVSFRFFNWLCSNDGFVPDDRCCNLVFDGLVQAKAAKVARSFKRDMEFSPKEKSLEAYVVCLCEDGDVIEAVKEMSELKSRGYLVSLEVWNTLLKDSLRVGRTDFVLELYGEMIECGVVGDVSTVGYVISAFCKDNKLSEAHELLRQVIESGVVPEVTVFTHLISGYCHEKKYDKVSAVLHLMIANNCNPTVFTYQEIIHGVCKNRMEAEAFRIFNDLKEKGYTLNTIMYTIMIDGLCKIKSIGPAKKLWFEMSSNGLSPNEYTYDVLIKGYCKIGKLEEAWKLWKEMGHKGIKQTTWNYNTLIAGLCLHGKTDEASKLFGEMPNMEIKHDVVTYNTLIRGFCDLGKTEEATKFHHDLLATDLQPSAASYAPLIKKLSEKGEVRNAIDLWNDMLNRDLKPDARSWDHIIQGLCKEGNAIGLSWLTMMLQYRLRPLSRTFNEIIKCLTSKNLVDDALMVLHTMAGMGYKHKKSIFDSLVNQVFEGKSASSEVYLDRILGRRYN
ncbi:hypothetical protein ACHQM5_004903 [Ranunculus cassubicifolius]